MTPRIEHINQNGVEKKKCSSCQIYKSLDNYNKCKGSWDALRPECKGCLTEKRKVMKEKKTEYNKKYWKETKEKQKEKNKEWREKNKEYIKEKMADWLEKNKEHKKQKDKEYREKNWEKKREYNRIWNLKNYQDMKTNPERKDEFRLYTLQKNMARRIREILKQEKSKQSLEYVGCSIEELKKHLESKFKDGMTWDNYGIYKANEEKSGWHIDHIIPCASFNFGDEIEKKACFYYMNLQPLWGKENIVKSNTVNLTQKTEYIEYYKNQMKE